MMTVICSDDFFYFQTDVPQPSNLRQSWIHLQVNVITWKTMIVLRIPADDRPHYTSHAMMSPLFNFT
jgi:hypothetical protein